MNTDDVKLYVRHGIFSNSANMTQLEQGLQVCVREPIDNLDYDWKQPVLVSAIELADHVLRTVPDKARVVLVGHSQGGLVARLAAALMVGVPRTSNPHPPSVERMLRWKKSALDDGRGKNFSLLGVVMLATPNAGAFSFGQLSVLARLGVYTGGKLAGQLGSRSLNNIEDLTSDRVFRTLQYWEVAGVKYLSISGSSVNRYNVASVSTIKNLAFRRFGANIDIPNDTLVEDVSVDLRESVLPNELSDPDSQYVHIRRYIDCIDIDHSDIHSTPVVHELIQKEIGGWTTS